MITDVQIDQDGHIKIGWKDPNYAAALFTLEEMQTAVRLVYEQLQEPGPAPDPFPESIPVAVEAVPVSLRDLYAGAPQVRPPWPGPRQEWT